MNHDPWARVPSTPGNVLIVIERNGSFSHVIVADPALAEPPTPSPRPQETASLRGPRG